MFHQIVVDRVYNGGDKAGIQEVEDDLRVAATFETHLKTLAKIFKKYGKLGKALTIQQSDLSTTAAEFHSESKMQLCDKQIFSALHMLSDYERAIADECASLFVKIETLVSARHTLLVDTALQEAGAIEKAYDQARSSVEAARSSLVAAQNKEKKNPQKISQLEAALDKAKQGFVSVGEECCEWLHFVTSVVEADLIENLCDYLELYRDFFQSATRYVNGLVPTVYQFRTYSQSCKEKRESKAALNKAGMEKREDSMFGRTLEDLWLVERNEVPLLITTCCRWIEVNLIDTEGIYWRSVVAADLAKLQTMADRLGRAKIDLSSVSNPHLVTSLLKTFLRDLPEPLMTSKLYFQFLDINNIKDEGVTKITKLKAVLELLPQTHFRVLAYVVAHLYRVCMRQRQNMMAAGRLATIFAPLLMMAPENSQQMDPFECRAVVEYMIMNVGPLFELPPDVAPPFSEDMLIPQEVGKKPVHVEIITAGGIVKPAGNVPALPIGSGSKNRPPSGEIVANKSQPSSPRELQIAFSASQSPATSPRHSGEAYETYTYPPVVSPRLPTPPPSQQLPSQGDSPSAQQPVPPQQAGRLEHSKSNPALSVISPRVVPVPPAPNSVRPLPPRSVSSSVNIAIPQHTTEADINKPLGTRLPSKPPRVKTVESAFPPINPEPALAPTASRTSPRDEDATSSTLSPQSGVDRSNSSGNLRQAARTVSGAVRPSRPAPKPPTATTTTAAAVASEPTTPPPTEAAALPPVAPPVATIPETIAPLELPVPKSPSPKKSGKKKKKKKSPSSPSSPKEQIVADEVPIVDPAPN